MILIDVNLLLYANNSSFPQFEHAREWLDAKLNGSAQVGLPWECILGFLRIATNTRIMPKPLSTVTAWQRVTEWLARPSVWIPQATEQHAAVLADLLNGPGVQGNLIHDAHLAALAIEHGLTLCSTDGDFARFPKLRWENPLRP